MNHNYDILIDSLKSWNVSVTEKQLAQLDLYYELLVEKNKVMNLTSIVEFDEVIIKHYLDSLSLSKYLIFNNGSSIVDLGTGAGFPGIPLAIIFPDCSFTLIDSLNKRILFLQDVVVQLGLTNVSCVHSRAEDAGHNSLYREKFDFCVSRAVSNISTLTEYCLPLVKVNGMFISYKSGNIDDELKNGNSAISKLGGSISNVYHFDIPSTDIARSFVFIEKVKITPSKYPRKSGIPSKEPL